MQVGWLLDRDADLHVNEDQPLFEAAYHGAVRALAAGRAEGWEQCGLLSLVGGWPRAGLIVWGGNFPGLERALWPIYSFFCNSASLPCCLIAATQGMRVW